MFIAETRHLERWWSFIVAIEICSSEKSFKITIFFFGSNLQLSLKCTSFTGRTFPSNHKTPIIHEEHLIFRVNNNTEETFPKSLLNNISVLLITLPFLELTRASPSHRSKLINLGSLDEILPSVQIYRHIKTSFKKAYTTWLALHDFHIEHQ